jgi:hypothetical protein
MAPLRNMFVAGVLAMLEACSQAKPAPRIEAGAMVGPATVKSSCAASQAGAAGVTRTFCDGPAVVHVTLDGKDQVLSGGTCQATGKTFSLNYGAVVLPGAPAPLPDYVGLATDTTGIYGSALLSVRLDGTGYLFGHVHG